MKSWVEATARGRQRIDLMEFKGDIWVTDVYEMPNGEIWIFDILVYGLRKSRENKEGY